MSLNNIYEDATDLHVPVPAGTVSGQPLVLGAAKLAAHALTTRDANGEATCRIGRGAGEFKVTGKDAGGNSAVAWFDKIYIDGENKLSKNAGGTLYGYALGTVAAGAENVMLTVKLARA